METIKKTTGSQKTIAIKKWSKFTNHIHQKFVDSQIIITKFSEVQHKEGLLNVERKWNV